MKKSSEEQHRRCLDGVVNLWAETSKAFMMSELATYPKMSKETLYVPPEDKEEMILSAIDQWFDKVKVAKMRILSDPDLTTIEKARLVMIVQPEGYGPVAISSFTEFPSEHPGIHHHIVKRLQSGWESIIEFLARGMEAGGLCRVNISIPRTIVEVALEKLLSSREATKDWEHSLEEMMDLTTGGLGPRGEGQQGCCVRGGLCEHSGSGCCLAFSVNTVSDPCEYPGSKTDAYSEMMKAEGRLAPGSGVSTELRCAERPTRLPDRGEVERAKAQRKAHSHLDPSAYEHLDPSVVGLQYGRMVVPEGIVWLIQ